MSRVPRFPGPPGRTDFDLFPPLIAESKAGRLLRTTSLPIADVAAACGFYDHSAFVKRFRRHTGLAPLAYRKSGHGIFSGELIQVIRAGRANLAAE